MNSLDGSSDCVLVTHRRSRSQKTWNHHNNTRVDDLALSTWCTQTVKNLERSVVMCQGHSSSGTSAASDMQQAEFSSCLCCLVRLGGVFATAVLEVSDEAYYR